MSLQNLSPSLVKDQRCCKLASMNAVLYVEPTTGPKNLHIVVWKQESGLSNVSQRSRSVCSFIGSSCSNVHFPAWCERTVRGCHSWATTPFQSLLSSMTLLIFREKENICSCGRLCVYCRRKKCTSNKKHVGSWLTSLQLMLTGSLDSWLQASWGFHSCSGECRWLRFVLGCSTTPPVKTAHFIQRHKPGQKISIFVF